MRKSRFNEEQIIAIFEGGGGGDSPRRAVPAARDHTREPVPVEGEVRGDGSERGAATAAAGVLGLGAWGGDAILSGDRFAIIDFNDWPSFSRVRAPAARAIARRAISLLNRPR